MSSRPVLLITLPSLGMGGTEQFLTSLANQLCDYFEVHFFIFSENTALKHKLRCAKVHLSSGPLRGILMLPKVTHTIKPDIILTSIIDLNLIIIALRFLYPAKTRIIVRETSDPDIAISSSRFPKLTGFLYRHLYPRADRIVCLSESMRKGAYRLMRPYHPKVEVISNGVGDHRLQSLPITTSSEKIVLAVGRLSWEKGFDQLIKAFSCFVKAGGGCGYQLVILGDGKQKAELQMIIDELDLVGHVHLQGQIDDPVPFYAQASFLALPSHYEGVSNVMLEALANGLPVLATRERTSAEYYIDNTNGLLIDSCDEQTILKGLEYMNQNLRHFDRNNNAEKWRQKLRLDIISGRYADLFRELIA